MHNRLLLVRNHDTRIIMLFFSTISYILPLFWDQFPFKWQHIPINGLLNIKEFLFQLNIHNILLHVIFQMYRLLWYVNLHLQFQMCLIYVYKIIDDFWYCQYFWISVYWTQWQHVPFLFLNKNLGDFYTFQYSFSIYNSLLQFSRIILSWNIKVNIRQNSWSATLFSNLLWVKSFLTKITGWWSNFKCIVFYSIK